MLERQNNYCSSNFDLHLRSKLSYEYLQYNNRGLPKVNGCSFRRARKNVFKRMNLFNFILNKYLSTEGIRVHTPLRATPNALAECFEFVIIKWGKIWCYKHTRKSPWIMDLYGTEMVFELSGKYLSFWGACI